MRTGILGGTFDPIHVAHLHAGEVALVQANLDRVLFIPAGDPWQKSGNVVSEARHRLEMTKIATESVTEFEADSTEIDRAGPTYAIDTLESFPAAEELFLIVGSDVVAGMRTWHRASDVMARVSLLVAPRPGEVPPEMAEPVSKATVLDMARLAVSATDIRNRVRKGQPFRFLVAPGVFDYISEHGLYTDSEIHDRVGLQLDQEDQP